MVVVGRVGENDSKLPWLEQILFRTDLHLENTLHYMYQFNVLMYMKRVLKRIAFTVKQKDVSFILIKHGGYLQAIPANRDGAIIVNDCEVNMNHYSLKAGIMSNTGAKKREKLC
mgnify:CR=1 FL=1